MGQFEPGETPCDTGDDEKSKFWFRFRLALLEPPEIVIYDLSPHKSQSWRLSLFGSGEISWKQTFTCIDHVIDTPGHT